MRLLICLCLFLAIAGTVFSQEAIVIGTGLSDKTYSEGQHQSSSATVVPAGGVNARGASLDVTNLTDPKVCVKLALEESIDGGVTRKGGGAIEVCGQPGGFKDKQGKPISSVGFQAVTSEFLPANAQLFSTMEIIGAPLKTSAAVQMWEVK